MKYRPTIPQRTLTACEEKLLPRLLQNMRLHDVHNEIRAIHDTKCKGDFEQETLGPPTRGEWPFFT
jgi:hypothetical protein